MEISIVNAPLLYRSWRPLNNIQGNQGNKKGARPWAYSTEAKRGILIYGMEYEVRDSQIDFKIIALRTHP